jgi:hypothetical protein
VSARVCLVRRQGRGCILRALRLVGPTTDDLYPTSGVLEGAPEDYANAARWVRERLAGARSDTSIAFLCLDGDGGICTWTTAPGTDRTVVAASARLSGTGSTLTHYAPSDAESSLEPLGASVPAGAGGLRVPVLGITDIPARLLIDALDRENVPVEGVGTIWHALAWAWDPASPSTLPPEENVVVDAGPVTGVVLADPDGRLVWCWARAGRLLAGGSMRVRSADGNLDLGEQEASRLVAEWLAWSLQLGLSPRRIICVLATSAGAPPFAEALARAWPGAPFDAVPVADPIGATLQRVADKLESSPRALAADLEQGLPSLTSRPGRAHRLMHLWRAGALVILAGALFIGAWQFSRFADQTRDAARQWHQRWESVVRQAMPNAPRVVLEKSLADLLREEVDRKHREAVPIETAGAPMPVLEELESVMLVLASASASIEEVYIDSVQRPRIVVSARTTQQAEDIHLGLQRIAGSNMLTWSIKLTDQPRGTERRLRAEYVGEWDRDATHRGAPH